MEKEGRSAVLWWVGWIALTIAAFFASCAFWTRMIAHHVGSMQKAGAPILWVASVFGTWMVLLIPLIILMYQKVDKAYEDARIARERVQSEASKKKPPVRCVRVEDSLRLLNRELAQKLRKQPEAIRHGHLVTAVLRDGRRIDNVFVMDRKDVRGVYGMDELTFRIADIVDVEPADLEHLPDFRTEGWLRFDGV